MKVFTVSLLVSTVLAALGSVSQVEAHSWLTKPVSREHDADGADLDNTMACPNNTPGKVTSFKAGETIDVRYWRNNHIGGFIRWSIVPKGKETKANLDKSESIFHYSCRESGPECVPKGASNQKDMYADDGGDENTISCGDKITLPDWLPAGDYVLQWTWFGVGSDYGNIGWEESMFRSCADIKLTTAGSKSAAPKCPTFTGGDRVTKMEGMGNDKCFYFYRTEIANSQFKGSNDAAKQYYKFGVPTAIEKCSGSTNMTTPAPATSSAPAPGTPTKAPTPTRTPRPSMIHTPAPTSSNGDDKGDEGDEGDDNGDDGEDNETGNENDNNNDDDGDEGEGSETGNENNGDDGDNEDGGDDDTNEDSGDNYDNGDGNGNDDEDKDDWRVHGKHNKHGNKHGNKD